MTKLNFLGIGSCFNTKLGNTSCFYKEDDYLLLIDCGESIFERIIDTEILDKVNKIDILITHIHTDHVGSLSSLIYYLYYLKNIIVDIYFADDLLVNMLTMFNNIDMYNYHHIEYDKKIVLKDKVEVIPVQITHEPKLTSVGYILDLGEEKYLYSGDSKELFPNALELIREHNALYYQDIGTYNTPVHMYFEDFKKLIPMQLRKNVYCMHLDTNDYIQFITERFNIPQIYSKNR